MDFFMKSARKLISYLDKDKIKSKSYIVLKITGPGI